MLFQTPTNFFSWVFALEKNVAASQLEPRIVTAAEFIGLHGCTPLCTVCGFDPERALSFLKFQWSHIALPKLHLKNAMLPQKNAWMIWPKLRNLSRLHAYSASCLRSRCYIFDPFGFGGTTPPGHCWWHQGPKTSNTVAQLQELGRVSWKLAFTVGFLLYLG